MVGVSNTHYLFNGKVKKATEENRAGERKKKEQKGFWYFAFGFVVVFFYTEKTMCIGIVRKTLTCTNVGNKWIKFGYKF